MAKETNTPAQVENPQESAQVVSPETTSESNGYVTFEGIVKTLEKTFGKATTHIVKNVNYDAEKSETRVTFTLKDKILGNITEVDENGNTVMDEVGNPVWKKGLTSVVYTSSIAIAGTLKEMERFGWLGNYIINNPKICGLLLNGATIKIVQQVVPAGTAYVNPFSQNKATQSWEHDVYINHIVDIQLSKEGAETAKEFKMNLLMQ